MLTVTPPGGSGNVPGGTGTVRVDAGVPTAPDYVKVGSNPAAAGALRVANAATAVAARNAANSGDVVLLSTTSGNVAQLGDATCATKVLGTAFTVGPLAGASAGVVKVSTGGVCTNGLLTNAEVDPAAAIAGTKIAPAFGSQTVEAIAFKAPSSSPFSLSSAAVVFSSDANRNATGSEYNCHDLTVTSAVSLTATRNLVVPLTAGGTWRVYNGTTGAQSIQVIGATGTGVTIANAAWGTVRADGTNVVSVAAAGGGGGSTPTGTGFVHVTAGVQDAAAALVVNADVDAAAGIVVTKLALGAANQVLVSDGATNSWSGLPTVTRVDVTSSYRVNGTHALGFSGTVLKGANQTTWTSYLMELQATGTFDWSWGGTTYWTLTGNGGAVAGTAAAAATSLTIQHAARTTPGTGGNLTIKAQDGNTGGGGGSLILAAGDKDAAGTPGTVQVYCYGGTQLTISSGTGGFLFKPAKAQSACTYQQEDNTTASATGATTTICSQNATGATAIGGDMAITTGTGTSRSGNLLLSATGSGAAAGYVACTSNAQEIWRCQTDGTYLLKYGGVQIMASDTSGQIGIKSLKGLSGNPFKLAYIDKSIAAGGTITLANTEYDYADINLSGAQASATTVVFPATIGATWRVTNNATAAYGVALQASGGSRLVHVGRAQVVEVRCDGTELYVINGKPPVVVLAEGLIDYNGTSGTNTDTTLYTFPANAFGIITSVELVLDTAQTGATSVCTLTVGDTAGGTQWIVSQTINTSTSIDTDYGLTLTHLGTNFDAARGYVYVKPRATSKSVIARCARSVATVTAGKLRYRVIGSVSW